MIEWTEPTSVDVVIAACLHDAIEDQSEKLAGQRELARSEARARALANLESRFGVRVAALVACVTNPDDAAAPDGGGGCRARERDRAREEERYTEHVLAVLRNEPEAAAIKLADFGSNALRLDRVDTSTADGQARKHRLRRKYAPTMRFLLTHLSDLPPEHPLHREREKVLGLVRRAWTSEFEGRV